MAQGKVEICGVNTAKLPILNEKEKEALFVRIKAGDQEAKEEYIKGNEETIVDWFAIQFPKIMKTFEEIGAL